MNLGVQALLGWVRATVGPQGSGKTVIDLEELQNGEILLKLVYLLKKESNPHLGSSVDERFKIITDFVERDCRFCAFKGTPISWKDIHNGTNLTTELSKVLLLLVYHDMMNDHRTLSTIGCEVESQIATLTATYVMESEGNVYLKPGLDAHFTRRYLSVPRDIFEKSTSTSVSSGSSIYEDDESPLFVRSQKVRFQDMQNVASSSVSNSPLQDIMNTPIFQIRKMQRQLIQDRDYRDGLEKELSCKLAVLAQRESQINQLQYCLDKMKEEQVVREQSAREQIDELENKNNALHLRFDGVLKENKELKSNSALMERKVDELADENGVLSSQMRTVCSQLSIFEAEVGRLMETQTTNEKEWKSTSNHLQSELNQALAQKDLLTEQIEILQAKISCLEDEISRATKEEVGENMWLAMEKKTFENKITTLTDQLEDTIKSLQMTKEEVQTKMQQLKEYEQEISQQKELLIQQENQRVHLIQSKNDAIETLHKEMTEVRKVFQDEICQLKLKLEQVEQQKNGQITRLQQQVASCEQQIEKLKEIKRQKEDHLLQAEASVVELTEKLCAVNNLLVEKDQEVNRLTEKVDVLVDMQKQVKDESQAKEEMFSQLLLKKSQEEEIFQSNIQMLTGQVDILKSSLKQAEEEVQIKQNLLSKTQQEKGERIEVLQRNIYGCEETISKLKEEIQAKNQQLVDLQNDSSRQSEKLQEDIRALKSQIDGLCESLRQAELRVQAQQVELRKREEESSHEKGLLQQQLSASEETVKILKAEMKIKAEQMSLMENQNREQSEFWKNKMNDLQQKVESLKSQLTLAEESLHLKDSDFILKQQQSNQQVEELQVKISEYQDELKRLHAQIHTKEEELLQLQKETSAEAEHLKTEHLKQSEVLKNEIHNLSCQVQSLNASLNSATEQLKGKEELLASKEMDICHEKDVIQNLRATFDDEIKGLRLQINNKEEQMVTLKNEANIQSNLHQQEIQHLKDQLDKMADTLSEAEEKVQTQLLILTQQEQKNAQEQQQLSASEETVKNLKEEIMTKVEQISFLENQNREQSDSWKKEINDLQQQVENLKSQLTLAEYNLHLKESDFTVKQQQNNQQVEELQVNMIEIQGELKRLHAQIQTKEEQFVQLKTEATAEAEHLKTEHLKQSEVLKKEIHNLSCQVQSLNASLNSATEQLKVKEDLLASKEIDICHEKDVIQNLKTTLNDEIKDLKLQISAKEEQVVTLKNVANNQSNLHQQEIQHLKKQIDKMADTLSKAEQKVQTQLLMLTQQEQKSAQEQEMLQQQLKHSEVVIRKLEDEICVREQHLTDLKTHNQDQSEVLCEQNVRLQRQLEALSSSLKETEEKMRSKESLLAQQQQEHIHKQEELCGLQVKMEQMEKESASNKHKNDVLQESLNEKEDLLVKTQEQYQMVQMELSVVKIMISEKDKDVYKLKQDALAQADLIHKADEKVQNKDKMLIKLKEESFKEIETLKFTVGALTDQVEDVSVKLAAKEEQLIKIQQESVQQIDLLKQEIVSVNAELNQQNQTHVQVLRQTEEMLLCTQKERDALFDEKEVLTAKTLAVEKQLEVSVFEKERLAEAKQAIEGENLAAQKLETMLQQELEILRQDKETLLNEKKKAEDVEMVKKDLLEQLSAKSTAVEHYKAQMENAMSYYNSKKQILHETEEEMANLKHSLEVKEREVKTVFMEHKLLQMELEKFKSNEKLLLNKVASLEAQLAFADKTLRAQNKIQYHKQPPCSMAVPSQQYNSSTREKVRCMSSDSLDTSSMDDSLNNTRKLSAPHEASTPLVRSSERLAVKRRALQAESLETLYFTPIKAKNSKTTDFKHHEDSAMQNPASSVKRRRTTQVINITMTKKTPGCNEADETFYSLTSARSQPNLSIAHKAQGVSTELFTTPAKVIGSDADQLIGLPGYRRSIVPSQTTSTFCVGAENEPEVGQEDWLRIAEIQARNKACLPHLKSSYPLEFDTVRNSALMCTDEELRTGDPSETIRRASMMPGQLQDSMTSHRLSYMGQGGSAATARSRLSLMPGQVVPKSTSSTNLRSPKGTKRAPSTLTIPLTSPEKKVRASCFPRPLTPKNKNGCTGSAIPKVQAALSPADQRKSMMFTIENTPKKESYLKKSLNKLRSSTRKSPGKSVKKSPAQAASRRGQENTLARTSRTATGGAGRLGDHKSPLVANKRLRKSPQVSTRAAKSPGLTASARKMMSRMKV